MERIGAQCVTFVVSLVLARILIPEDYGVVAIAQIFINLANVFVTQGLNAALIQRKEAGDLEYSTAFYANLVFSVLLYGIIFIGSPFIAGYYENHLLVPIFRVLGLRLIIGALNSIQRAYVSRKLQFKKFFLATIGGTIISAFVGIGMALAGAGAWAIIGQYLTNSIIDTIVLWFTISWHPKKMFSKKALHEMFGFGWKVFAAALFNELYLELRSLIIGKKYSSSDLAYYNRGKQFPQLFYTNLASTITSVMFPVMSRQSQDLPALSRSVRRTIQMEIYIIMPIMLGLAAVSETLVRFLLTDRWMPCVPYLCAYCVSYIVLPIQSILEQLYKALGRSDIVLKLFFIEKIVGIVIILISMRYSVWIIAIGMIITSYFCTIVHMIPMKNMIGYSILDLLKDNIIIIIVNIIMTSVVLLVGTVEAPLLVKLAMQCASGLIVYLSFSIVVKSEILKFLLQTINGKLNNKYIRELEKRL